jgi:hypothetical protein
MGHAVVAHRHAKKIRNQKCDRVPPASEHENAAEEANALTLGGLKNGVFCLAVFWCRLPLSVLQNAGEMDAESQVAFFARIDCRGMPPRSCRRENMSCLSAIADVVAAVFRVLVNCYATARCRYSLTPPALLSGASRSICQVNAACQTIPYVRLGRYLASLFVPVWRTTYNRTAGLRGMNANIDIQRQFCA